MTNFKMETVSLDLLDNSFDFIEKGLESIISDNQREFKYAILHLFSGTLLFLKDILYKEHWTLLFQDVDNASLEELQNGKIKSVNFDTLIKRLQNSNKVKLQPDFIDELRWMQKERNMIEHFTNKLNPYEVKSRVADLLNQLIIFIRKHKKSDPNYSVSSSPYYIYEYEAIFEMIQNYSFQFKSFVEKRKNIIKQDLEKSYLVINCSICKQKSVELIPDTDLTICHFCLNESTLEMFYYMNTPVYFDEYNNEVSEYSTHCPECEKNMLYKDDNKLICFGCFITFAKSKLSNCSKCDKPVILQEGELSLCDLCLDSVMS